MDFGLANRVGAVCRGLAIGLILGSSAISSGQVPERYRTADLRALQEAFTELAERVRPSVVAIRTYQIRNPSSEDRAVRFPHSQGSGLIIDSGGLIATNTHVIEGAQLISVVLQNGWRFDARIQQVDLRSDLAVLKIDAENLPAARLGNASSLKVNQWVFACGNPFGLANDDGRASITYGVVSALGRNMTDRLVGAEQVRYYGNLIETSAAINPGSSGGALFDIDGQVVGIVTAIETASGVNEGHGFAIPVDPQTIAILEALKAGRAFRYGFLGVTVDEVDAPESRRVAHLLHPRGAKIARVDPPTGPAARAGLQPNDVVIEFNGTPIEDKDHLVRLVGFTPVGSQAEITFLRKRVKRKINVTIADRHETLGQIPQSE